MLVLYFAVVLLGGGGTTDSMHILSVRTFNEFTHVSYTPWLASSG